MKQMNGKLIKFRTYEEHLESDSEDDFLMDFEMNYIFVENPDNISGKEIVGIAYLDGGIAFAVNGVVDEVSKNIKYITCLLVNQNDCYRMAYYECGAKNNIIIRKVEFTEGKDILVNPKLFCYGKANVKTIEPENFMFPEELVQKHAEIKEMSNDIYNDFADYLFTDMGCLYTYVKDDLMALVHDSLRRFVVSDKTQLATPVEMYVIVKGLINDISSLIVNSAIQTDDGGIAFDEHIAFGVENRIKEKICKQISDVDKYQEKYVMAATVNVLKSYSNDKFPNVGLCLAYYVLYSDSFADATEEDCETLIVLGIMEEVKEPEICAEWLNKFKEIKKIENDVVEEQIKILEFCKNDQEKTNFLYAYELLKVCAEKKNKNVEEIVKHTLLAFAKYKIELKKTYNDDLNNGFDNLDGIYS